MMAKHYDLHRLLLTQTCKRIRKENKSLKKKSDHELVGLMCYGNQSFVNTLDFQIMGEESFWKKNNAHVLFPGDDDMYKRLLSAKFDLDGPVGFDLPFESFVVAMPKGYKIDDYPIPPFLVTFMDYLETNEQIIEPFAIECGIGIPKIGLDQDAIGKKMMLISYQDPYSPATVHQMQSLDNLGIILASQNTKELEERSRYADQKHAVIELTDEDLEVQFRILKLVAALGVYHMATGGKRLMDGYPGGDSNVRVEKEASLKTRNYSLLTPLKERSSPGEHVRNWHFRQLKHDRYYKGEFSKQEKGSRWVFVDSFTVGAKATPHTQN